MDNSSFVKTLSGNTVAVTVKRRGLMLVLSSPSGAGKTTIAHRLLEEEDNIFPSISTTTRSRRPSEIEGKHYYFTDLQSFAKMKENNELLEYAEVFGNYYGTPRAPVERMLSEGKDILFDIDWQGRRQLAEVDQERDLVSIFILPPTADELERRLRSRASDSEEVIALRMAKSANEMNQYFDYDYVIVNNDVEQSVKYVRAILNAERLKRTRQVGLKAFVDFLGQGLKG